MTDLKKWDMPMPESDPHNKDVHESGAKLDAGKLRTELVLGDFAHALLAVVKIGTDGAVKYTDGGWLEVPDGERRYADAAGRHRLKRQIGKQHDKDSGDLHLAHEAWNILAQLELHLRKKENTNATV